MEEYPSESDYRVIVEEELGRDTMQRFLRGEKHFFVHTHTTGKIADISRRILFGYPETEILRKDAMKYESKKKSTAFTIASKSSLGELEADLTSSQTNEEVFNENKEIQVDRARMLEDGLEVEIGYVHKRATQRRLLDADPKSTKVRIQGDEDDEIRTVEHDYEKGDEFNAVKDFFEGWMSRRRAEEEEPIEKIDITLDRLPLEDRVDLFNEILSSEPGTWRLDDVLQIGIEQGEDLEEVLGEYEDEEELEELLDEHLQGITNAVLTGRSLRANRFVQTCIDNGYYFKSGKLLYTDTDIARQVQIVIEFKSSPKDSFDISLGQEYQISGDGDPETTSFDDSARDEIRDKFRDMVVRLYLEHLPEELDIDEITGPNELTDIPGIGVAVAENLRAAGYDSPEDLTSADPDDLLQIDRIGKELAAKLTGAD